MFQARRLGIGADPWGWDLEVHMLESLKSLWHEPDEGIWEVRGPRRHFTHSKVMAWVAFDRAIKSAEQFGLKGPVDDWRRTRDEIHAQVCARAFDSDRGTFTQTYDRPDVDAALLMIPLVGFLPASDPRVVGTVRAIERDLLHGGFVRRYRTENAKEVDGQDSPEGVFLPCSFWLADVYVQMNRRDEAERLFNRLVGLANDVGLFSEEYDPVSGRMLGNFPQAFSHLALVTTAFNLGAQAPGSQVHRSGS
jgi:GH15 family glucan-1,4-alpha-glucosidase